MLSATAHDMFRLRLAAARPATLLTLHARRKQV